MSIETIKLNVNLQERSYPIYIGKHLFSTDLLANYIAGQQVLVVTNEKIGPIYLPFLQEALNYFEYDEILLPDGEEHKNLDCLKLIFDRLVTKKHRRSTTLLGLGGGVIGDITGFAAACYQRGVPFIQVPTSLLAQVDASVGGKTAVNHPLSKNMIGAFHQPKAVIIDIETLNTLSDREFNSGLAEIIKAGLIKDEDFFCWLETNLENLLSRDQETLRFAIKQACAIKIQIVVADEKEANIRALLNLGHTFAHAIEQSLGYGTWLHGEAVAVGLIMAASLSVRLRLIDESILHRIKNILTMAKLPIRLPNSISVDQVIDSMSTDKKKDSEHLTLVLLKGIGRAVLSQNIDITSIQEAIAENQQP